jgi:hypothetical protein
MENLPNVTLISCHNSVVEGIAVGALTSHGLGHLSCSLGAVAVDTRCSRLDRCSCCSGLDVLDGLGIGSVVAGSGRAGLGGRGFSGLRLPPRRRSSSGAQLVCSLRRKMLKFFAANSRSSNLLVVLGWEAWWGWEMSAFWLETVGVSLVCERDELTIRGGV